MNERTGISEIKVGLFVTVAMILLLLGTLWIVGSSVLKRDRVTYQVLLKNSQGVKKGDRVRFAGVSVGRIQSVTLQPQEEWPVRLEVAMNSEIPIRENASARFTSDSLLGSSFLEIDPGTLDSPVLSAGGDIYGIEAQGLSEILARLDQISGKAFVLLGQTETVLGELTHDVGPLLHQLGGFLSESNADAFGEILQSARDTLQDTRPQINRLMERMESVTAGLEEGMEDLPTMTRNASDLLENLRRALGPDGDRLALVLENAATSLAAAAATLGTLSGHRDEIAGTMIDLRDTAANLKALSQLLKERPFSLIRIKPVPDRRPRESSKGTSP